MIIFRRLLLVFAAVQLVCSVPLLAAEDAKQDSRARRLESRADKTFIRGDYDKAMKLYNQANDRLESSEQKYALQLKMGRLYIMLQMPDEAILHYSAVLEGSPQTMNVNDACFFIDALRQQNRLQDAEVVARRLVVNSPYSLNQRYINTRNSLANQQHYYGITTHDFDVKRLDKNGPDAEYWVGEWNGDLFYAISTSRLQDPLKVFYHQTHYLALHDGSQPEVFRGIPRDLHSGPVVFTRKKDYMIATGINYRSTDHILGMDSNHSLFVTQLYYSRIDKNNVRWSRFVPVFEGQPEYNYAHPALFDDDRALIFSSDRPGGYGGMDLYVSRWDEASGKWGEPLNMGPLVNTEGDEIYPSVRGDQLYFSSNGQAGFGGYDIYKIRFSADRIIDGTLSHFPYPVNSVFNDFGLYTDDQTAYFVSDRGGLGAKDDIYWFPLSGSGNVGGISDQQTAMTGNFGVINGLMGSNTGTVNKDLVITPVDRVPERGEVLLSVYFDFNKYALTPESASAINSLMSDPMTGYIAELSIVGYADDIGGYQYNKRLSENRADAVAGYIRKRYADSPRLYVEGRGQLSLSQSERDAAMSDMNSSSERGVSYSPEVNRYEHSLEFLSFDEQVALKGKLRRVDIVVRQK